MNLLSEAKNILSSVQTNYIHPDTAMHGIITTWLAAYESRPKMRVKYEVIDDSYRWTWTIGDQVFRFGDTSVADAKRFAELLGLELEVVE